MPKIPELVKGLAGGPWTATGTGQPVEEMQTIANPVASNPVPPAGADLSPTIQVGTGRFYVVVQDGEGHQRALYLTPSKDQGVAAPGVQPVVPITGRDAGTGTKPIANLNDANWDPGGALTDVPQGSTTKQPSATSALNALDATGKVVPIGDPSAKQMRDPATGTTFNLVTDPQGTLHDVGNDVWLVKPDGSHTVVGSKPKEPTQLNVSGVGLVEYDPKGTDDASKYHVVMPVPTNLADLGGIQTRNGKSYYPVKNPDGSVSFVETNLPADVKVTGTYDSPDSPYVIFTDQAGKEISRFEKPGWKPPIRVQPGTAPAADSTNPFIVTLDPTTGAVVTTPNTNQIKSSQATEDLAKQLGLKVAAGSMSEDQAQKIITGAINTMNAQSSRISANASQQQADNAGQQNAITAANNVLSNTSTNAQTGAGMLQNRVTSATGALSNMMGTIGSSKITDIPSDFGKNLVGGLSSWVTNMGGGDAVYETAARMVQGADPKISGDPTLAQQATQTLAQMMQQYQTQSGKPYPDVAATIAAKQSQGANGMVAPVTAPGAGVQQTNVQPNPAAVAANQASPGGSAFNPQASSAALRARGLLDTPQGRAIAAGQTPVAAIPPAYPGQYNPAWQQGMLSAVGLPSVGPNAANGFVAPPLPLIPA